MNRVLKCDGFKMFHGSFLVTPANGRKPFRVHGDWLLKPAYANGGYGNIWYVQPKDRLSESYDADILSDMRLEDDCDGEG